MLSPHLCLSAVFGSLISGAAASHQISAPAPGRRGHQSIPGETAGDGGGGEHSAVGLAGVPISVLVTLHGGTKAGQGRPAPPPTSI